MDIENKAEGTGTSSETHYLASSGVSIYNADKRPRHDTCWTVSYCLLAALTVFWGIAAFVHTDPNAGLYSNDFFYRSTSCDVVAFSNVHPLNEDDEPGDATFVRAFRRSIEVWLPITAVLAVFASALYMLLFRRFAKAMVTLTIVSSISLGLFFSIVCFATGAVPFGIILLVITIITALFYWWIRAQLRMCAELLAIAGRGLNENLALVPAAIGIMVAGMGVLVYSLAAFFSAITIGHAGPTQGVVIREGDEEDAVCYDSVGNNIPCCTFYTQGWAGAYAFFSACFMCWTVMLIMQIKLYTVADTIAQWYFSTSASSSASVGGLAQTAGSVRLALRHCLTTSFGSVAFAAAILALLRAIRRLLERAARQNIICCIINCIAQPLLALMEKFTRFATIATAITGQAFVPAAKSVFDTLKRNFLQTYSMWWVPDSVLQMTVFLLSLTWAGIVFFSTYGMNKSYDAAWGVAFTTAAVAFFLMMYTLMFVAGLLLDAVNTLYICYALDKDQRRVTHPEIHAIYMQVPGLAVENPDGGVMYGAPEPRPAGAPAPPPYAGEYQQVQMVPTYPTPQPVYSAQPAYPTVYPAQPAYNTGYSADPVYPGSAHGHAAAAPAGYTYVQPNQPGDRV